MPTRVIMIEFNPEATSGQKISLASCVILRRNTRTHEKGD